MNGHRLNERTRGVLTSSGAGENAPNASQGTSVAPGACKRASDAPPSGARASSGRRPETGRVAGIIRPRTTTGRSRPRNAGTSILESTAFGALGWVARGDIDVPLPRLDRVAAGKVRLMALVEARRAATAPSGLALATN